MSIQSIAIRFTDQTKKVLHSTEEYILDIGQSDVNISVTTIKGLHNALASLEQLLDSPVPLHSPVRIFDYPAYPYRGLLMDVARHYIPIHILKRTIDGMAASKFSVFHLHLSDAASFPVLLRDTPRFSLSDLAMKGSFPSGGGQPKIYTRDDLISLVQYAAERGIEIIPEVDMPSHVLSWSKAFPEIVVNCSSYAEYQDSPQNVYTLDPTNDVTLPIIYEILKQIAEIFPSPFIHIGGDEVHTECWMDLNIPGDITRHDLLHDLMLDIFKIVRSFGKTPIGWQDTIDQGVFPRQPEEASSIFVDSNQQAINLFETNKAFVLPAISAQTVASRDASVSRPSEFSDISTSAWAVVEAWKCWQGLAGKAAGHAQDMGLDVITSACWYLDYDSDLEVIF
jgi:N-acetyl-beta-hexosaminidase